MKSKVCLSALIFGVGSAFSAPKDQAVANIEWRGDIVDGKAIIKQIVAPPDMIFDSVNVPSTYRGAPVTGIVGWAFRNNRHVRKVAIPMSVRRISADTFLGCDSLTNVEIETSHPALCSIDGLVYSKDRKIFMLCPSGRNGEVRVADGTERIGANAFKGCSRLDSVVLPESCKKIDYGAFAGCSNLTTVIMSANVTNIFVHAWDGCDRLRNLTMPGDMRSENFSWYDATNVETITISKGCTVIADRAFQNRMNLKEVWIPDSVKVIGNASFSGCVSLRTIHFPSGLVAIGPSAFSGCVRLQEAMIPAGVELISDWAFAGCTNLTVQIPQGVTNISGIAFGMVSLRPLQRYGQCKVVGKDAEAQYWLDKKYRDTVKRSQEVIKKALDERNQSPRKSEFLKQKKKMNELMRKCSVR